MSALTAVPRGSGGHQDSFQTRELQRREQPRVLRASNQVETVAGAGPPSRSPLLAQGLWRQLGAPDGWCP